MKRFRADKTARPGGTDFCEGYSLIEVEWIGKESAKMFDWNGNGKIDTDDHAFTAFLLEEMNRKTREKETVDLDFPEEDDPDDYDDEGDD